MRTDSSAQPTSGKGRPERACDACRRRKTKCDGPWMPNKHCTNCHHANKPCTYVEASKPRGPPKAYITGMEDRIEELEALLNQLHPNTDFSEHLGPPIIRGSWKTLDDVAPNESQRQSSSSLRGPGQIPRTASFPAVSAALPPIRIHPTPQQQSETSPPSLKRTTHLIFKPNPRVRRIRSETTLSAAASSPWIQGEVGKYRTTSSSMSSSEDDLSSSSDTDSEELVVTAMEGRRPILLKASETAGPDEDNSIRFHGRSSTAGLVEMARMFRNIHLQDTIGSDKANEPPVAPDIPSARRPEFWRTPKWELVFEGNDTDSPSMLPSTLEHFPPPGLAANLINLYFIHTNLMFPLLHRPTFERQWEEGLHHRNEWFTCLCLSLFAVASRWCDDERVLPEEERAGRGEGSGEKPRSWANAGSKYFEVGVEIHRHRRSTFFPATLFEVQTFSLIAMYLRGTQMHSIAWLTVSLGLRRAQDVGAHRKKVYRGSPNADDELWKRAFWILVVFDRLGGAHLGRASGIADEDFDIDLPLEVDDEHWDGTYAFKQPSGVPSTISAFNQFIKMTQIIAFTLRTVYAIDKSKVFHGLMSGDWRDEVLKQLNTAMEEWLTEIPEHLRWSDKMANVIFSSQAATIHTLYHLTQLLICRPFIPHPIYLPPLNISTPHRSPPKLFSYPALSLSISAAKSCARIIKAQSRFGLDGVHVPNLIHASCLCASTLLLGVWNLKAQEKAMKQAGTNIEDVKPPLATQIEDLMKDIQVLIDALEWVKPRWEFVEPFLSNLKESLPDNQDISPSSMTPTSQPDEHLQTEASTAELCLSFPTMKQTPSNAHWLPAHSPQHILPSPLPSDTNFTFSRLPPSYQPPPPDPSLFFKQLQPDLLTFADVYSAKDERSIRLPLVNHPLIPQPQRASRHAEYWDNSNWRGRTTSASVVSVPTAVARDHNQPVSYNGHTLRRTWSSGSLDRGRVHSKREKQLRRQDSFSSLMLSSSYPSVPATMVCDDINMHYAHEPVAGTQQNSQRYRADSVKPLNSPYSSDVLGQQGFRLEAWNDNSRHQSSRHGDHLFRSASGLDSPSFVQPSTSRSAASPYHAEQVPPDMRQLAHPPTHHLHPYQLSSTYAQYHHPS